MFFRKFDWINSALVHVEVALLSVTTLVLVGAIFVEVLCRYVFFISTAWAEELARYLFVWTSYIGSAYALNEGSHIEVDIVPQLAQKVSVIRDKEKFVRRLEFIATFITVVFLLYFCFIWSQYLGMVAASTQTSPTMHIPMYLVYLPVPVGSALMIFHGVYLMVCHLTGNPTPKIQAELEKEAEQS